MFVIAEAGSNWRMGTPARDLAMARALIDVAREAGADAVKFQTFRAAMMTANPTDEVRDLEMPYDMIPRLAEMCEGIEFMSSAFSVTDAKAVDPYVKRHKVASPEITHLPLLRYLAATGKPVILSCGAAVPGAMVSAARVVPGMGPGEIVTRRRARRTSRRRARAAP